MNTNLQLYKKVNRIGFFIFQLFFCLFSTNVVAQLIVTPDNVATSLASNIAGDGVAISNATLNCLTDGAGTFNGVTSNIGLGAGIILTTGLATNSIGDNSTQASTSGSAAPDADLQGLNAAHGCDGCTLEFDFVPQGNTITFNYVFASEEYPNYFCSNYNDAFGFFITGPNPVGGSYVSQNIALIPGTSLPVTINNLGPTECNGVDNSDLYVENTGTSVTYNGFSVVLAVNVDVIACETYTLKLGVGDVADCGFDSGVFIQQNSLQSVGYIVDGNDISSTLIADVCTSTTTLEVTNGEGYTWSVLPSGSVSMTSATTFEIMLASASPQVYTVTGTNDCASVSTDITLVPIVDNINPTIVCPPPRNYIGTSSADITLPDLPYSVASTPVSDIGFIGGLVSDNCTPNNIIGVEYSDVEMIVGSIITVTRTYVATDDIGNSAVCDQIINISAAPIPVSLSISDPCNCDNSITVGGIEYAQEIITITPGVAPYTVTNISGLFDIDGNEYTPTTATSTIVGTSLTLTGYVPANGVDTYDITIEDSTTTSDMLIGGPCNECVVEPCDADNGLLLNGNN